VGRVGEGDTGVGGPDEAHKEHAVSDWRRVKGTIRAAFMDNGATHLESYTGPHDAQDGDGAQDGR